MAATQEGAMPGRRRLEEPPLDREERRGSVVPRRPTARFPFCCPLAVAQGARWEEARARFLRVWATPSARTACPCPWATA